MKDPPHTQGATMFTNTEIAWIKTAAKCAVIYCATVFVINHLPTNK